MSGRWHAALGYALTGEELDLPEAQAPDPSGLVDDLAALGWTRTRIADHARRLLEAEQGWPHLVPASLRAGCGAAQVWTPRQQKWWYEVAGGDRFSGPKFCRPCRAQERARKAEARRTHLEGAARKAKARFRGTPVRRSPPA